MGKEPVFVSTRHLYESYADFWALVDASGFRRCYVDEIDLEASETFITTPINGEIRPHLENCRRTLKGPQRATVIWWNLERPEGAGAELVASIRSQNEQLLQVVDAIWTSDRFMAHAAKGQRAYFCKMGSHPALSLGMARGASFQYDMAHMSYITPRRDSLYAKLSRWRMAPTGWGNARGEILRATRAMLNVHQTEPPITEPLRIVVAAAFRIPYLTESCADLYPLKAGETCLEASYGVLPGAISGWLRQNLSSLGENLHRELVEKWSFREGVMEAAAKTAEGGAA